MKLISVFALTVLILAKKASCYPDGAPTFKCQTMTPDHSAGPSNAPRDFTYNLSPACYQPGTSVTVNIKSNSAYKGILMMVKAAGDPGANYGTFDISKTTGFKLLACFGNPNSAVTHSSSYPKINSEFTWTAPNTNKELKFYVTFIKDYSTYWVTELNSISPCSTTVAGSTITSAANTQGPQGTQGIQETTKGNHSARKVASLAYFHIAVVVVFGILFF